MKLTYWAISCTDDAECYSIIGKTRKEALEKYLQRDEWKGYAAVVSQLEVEYDNAFDLLDILTNEGGGRLAGHEVKTYELVKLLKDKAPEGLVADEQDRKLQGLGPRTY